MIGIISDTHDNLDRLRRAIAFFNDAGCTLVIHAGDFVAPFAARELLALKCPVRAVYGNCDGEKAGLSQAFKGLGSIEEPPISFSHEGRSFTVRHAEGRDPGPRIWPTPDCLILGHTHIPLVEKRGTTLVVNPGECGGWLRGLSTVALLDAATMEVDIVPIV